MKGMNFTMMTKGRFGLSLSAIAIICFGFGALQQPQSVLLVAGFALLAEKDEWLNRQVMQALLLTVTYYFALLVSGWVFGGLGSAFGFINLYGAQSVLLQANGFVSGLLYLGLIVFSVIAAVNLLRGRDARLPLLSRLAVGAVSAAARMGNPTAPFQTPVSPVPAAPVVPAAAAAVAAPVLHTAAAEPVTRPNTTREQGTTPVAVAEPPARRCPSCSAPLQENTAFCTECGVRIQ